jgi:hypothetical protein
MTIKDNKLPVEGIESFVCIVHLDYLCQNFYFFIFFISFIGHKNYRLQGERSNGVSANRKTRPMQGTTPK